MRIHALLSWFDEQPDMLYDACHSHAEHCDTLIALDGRYAAYPAKRNRSSATEVEAILQAASDTRTPVVIEQRDAPWDGNYGGEVAKRAHLFKLGEQHSREEDWYWIFDGDFVVVEASREWRAMLAGTDALSAQIELRTRNRMSHPVFFRALRGLTVRDMHWRYVVPGGPELWGYQCVRPFDLAEEIAIEHRDGQRPEGRRAQRKRYYRDRDRRRIERELTRGEREALEREGEITRSRVAKKLQAALKSAGAQST